MRSSLFLFFVLFFVAHNSFAEKNDSMLHQIFVEKHLDNIDSEGELVYSFKGYNRKGEFFEDRIALNILEVASDGSKTMEFDIFSGENKRLFPRLSKRRQNPMFLFFFQKDAEQMSGLFGKKVQLFRGMVKRAFRKPIETETVEVKFEGKSYRCAKGEIKPYAEGDRHWLKEFTDKKYGFTICPEIPGKLYEIKAEVKSQKGEPIYLESMVYERFSKKK